MLLKGEKRSSSLREGRTTKMVITLKKIFKNGVLYSYIISGFGAYVLLAMIRGMYL